MPKIDCVSLVALECDRAKESYKECRGRKFRPVGNFEVSILYSQLIRKNQRTVAAKKPLLENRLA